MESALTYIRGLKTTLLGITENLPVTLSAMYEPMVVEGASAGPAFISIVPRPVSVSTKFFEVHHESHDNKTYPACCPWVSDMALPKRFQVKLTPVGNLQVPTPPHCLYFPYVTRHLSLSGGYPDTKP
jgi:hypothetical protein